MVAMRYCWMGRDNGCVTAAGQILRKPGHAALWEPGLRSTFSPGHLRFRRCTLPLTGG